jgi:quinolinate synthase
VVRRILEEHGPEQEILFGPDMFLGAFVEREIGRAMHVWDGECHVHAGIRPQDIERVRAEHPGADFLVHPECGCTTQVMEYIASGDISTEGLHILSTGQMIDYARENPGGTKIVATETGMLYPMHLADPTAELVPANRKAFCKYMKMITLEKVRDSLLEDRYEVKVPSAVADRARAPIERMVSVG